MLSSLISRELPSAVVAAMHPAKPPACHSINSGSPVGLKTLATLDNPLKPNCVKRNYAAFMSKSALTLPSFDDPKIEAAADEESEAVADVEEEQQQQHQQQQEEDYVVEDEDGDGDDEGTTDETSACWATYGKGKPSCRLPPPIPLLARTGNLTCHMPWVLKRIYKEDGSLVLREERVKHHEYFRAHRENGRLTLRLVEVDDRSPLLVSGPKRCEEEEEDIGDDEEDESQHDTDHEDLDDDDAVMPPSQDSRLLDHDGVHGCGSTPPARGMDIMRRSSSESVSASLSTSMPEPLCGQKWLERGSPIGQMQFGAMPLVRGY